MSETACTSATTYVGFVVRCEYRKGHTGLHRWQNPAPGEDVVLEWDEGIVHDGMTLGEAKAWLEARIDKGAECPCCLQNAKVYRRTINGGMARSLVRMYRLAGTDWIDITKSIPAKSREEGKLRYWGLIEAGDRRGVWRVTERGVDWLLLRITVPRYCLVYDQGSIHLTGDQISPRDVLTLSDSDYRELVGL